MTRPFQLNLFRPEQTRLYNHDFPSTRYQGSKRKLIEWIWANVETLSFETVLDVFGGTGAVSHLFKTAGKQVTYNDLMAFNHQIGLALIENSTQLLTEDDIANILSIDSKVSYPRLIQDTFSGIYYTDHENIWLDRIIYNINHRLDNSYKQSIARFALYQACIVKRPYNLFHRANLYMRLSNVQRSFGNKITWDTPFETHFRNFAKEANIAIFDNNQVNQAIREDALNTPVGADLVYIDPPYLNNKGIGVDYHEFYHFLEGMTDYNSWTIHIDHQSKHKRLIKKDSIWNDRNRILDAFRALIKRHQESILVISYRDDGIPSKQQIIEILRDYKKHIVEAEKSQKYALSLQNSKEVLLIAT